MSDFYSGRPVLIAGGLGFIGSHLAIELANRGSQVTVVDSLIPGGGGRLENIASVADRVKVCNVDLRDSDALPECVHGQSIIFSLAGQTSHIDSMHAPQADLEINCRAQLALLECCRHHQPTAHLVFTSTRQIYGRARYLPVDELHPVAPTDINGIHKLAAEQYYSLYSQVYGMSTVSLRLTNTYGPHMDLHPRKGFVGVFIKLALAGEPIKLFGDGSQQRDFNYVSDVVSALALAGQMDGTGGHLFNLGHDEHSSLREFLDTLNRHVAVSYQCQPFPAELSRIDIGDYYASYDKFHQATGWRPLVTLDEGLKRTIHYARELR
ncbi:MAG: NAD-dependent epimerase/dehydratase family protein [Pirellulaceae bacterium]|nr:NAD-dependent epimerase/dehydratase family protein [Pirellulaceae bacterium]